MLSVVLTLPRDRGRPAGVQRSTTCRGSTTCTR
jgi:hypothetical protein